MPIGDIMVGRSDSQPAKRFRTGNPIIAVVMVYIPAVSARRELNES